MENKKLLINRSISLFCVIMGCPVAFLVVYYASMFGISSESGPGGMDAVLNQLLYFTVWSNILAFIWVVLAFSATVSKNDTLNRIVEYPGFKNTPCIMMFITMSVSFLILYPMGFVGLLTSGNSLGYSTWMIFRISFLSPLLFQHLLVSVVLISDMIITKGYTPWKQKKENKSDIAIGLAISTIVPLCWAIPSIIAIATTSIVPQYPFMNLFPEVLGRDGTIVENSTLTIVLSWLTFAGIFVIWFCYYGIICYFTNKNLSKSKNISK